MPEQTRISDPAEARRALAEKTKDVGFAMLTTIGPNGEPHTRPMSTHEVDDDGSLWFFTYADSTKVGDIAANPRVAVGYADPGKNLWVSVTGDAAVVRDEGQVHERWSAPLKVFCPDGPDDTRIALVKVTPLAGEIWDGPSTMVGQAIAFARTFASGAETPPGDNVKLDLR